jgi:hypothetical protein
MKNSTKLYMFLIVIFLTTNILRAQVTAEEITSEFFKIYEKSPLKAVDYVFGTNKWMDRNKDGIENVKSQLTSLLALVGDYYSYEMIEERNIGESYKLLSYMLKFNRQPVRFTFIFYKPLDIWQIQNFKFDDDLDDALE